MDGCILHVRRIWVLEGQRQAVIDCMFVSLQNSYVEMLNPNVMVLGGEAFRSEDGALMNGISALIKDIPESSLAPSAMWGHSEKTAFCEPGSKFSSDRCLALGLSSLQTTRNKFLLFKLPTQPMIFLLKQPELRQYGILLHSVRQFTF